MQNLCARAHVHKAQAQGNQTKRKAADQGTRQPTKAQGTRQGPFGHGCKAQGKPPSGTAPRPPRCLLSQLRMEALVAAGAVLVKVARLRK